MSTVVLVLLCLAIAGRELYVASDKRLPRAQRELRDLRKQVADLTRRVENVPLPQPEPIPIVRPADDDRTTEALERVGDLADRVDGLERRLTGQLDGVDLDRAAQRALARSLDAVEQDVAELRREMLDRLDRQEGVVPALVLSEEGEAEALLDETFERCAADFGLQVRTRDPHSARGVGGGSLRGTRYHLSGRRAEALADELFGFARGMYDPRDTSPLAAMLTELARLHGGGVIRIGPFTAVRTASALLCGVLPDTGDVPAPGEPWELAAQVRDLPEDRQCDLSWLQTAA